MKEAEEKKGEKEGEEDKCRRGQERTKGLGKGNKKRSGGNRRN